MPRFFPFNMTYSGGSLLKALLILKYILCFLALFSFSSCGRVFFPIELETMSRSKRAEGQENTTVIVVSMTSKSIKTANLDPYKRKVIDSSDLNRPARILSAEDALIEKFPLNNNPGPYKLGVGDAITFGQIYEDIKGTQAMLKSRAIVKEDGFINILQVGRIKAEGLTQSELEDSIYEKLVEANGNKKFELVVDGFNSQKVSIVSQGRKLSNLKYMSVPMYLEGALSNFPSLVANNSLGHDIRIILLRDGEEFVFSYKNLLKSSKEKYRLFPDDKIILEPLNYRREAVLLVGETGTQNAVPINAIQRPTLSETLFTGASLNNTTSDFSQIYVLRRKKDFFNAYHLDITNPTRVNLASQFEMRPGDIIFVATQPLSLYSRTLSQILGTAGITLEARDVIRAETNQ